MGNIAFLGSMARGRIAYGKISCDSEGSRFWKWTLPMISQESPAFRHLQVWLTAIDSQHFSVTDKFDMIVGSDPRSCQRVDVWITQ